MTSSEKRLASCSCGWSPWAATPTPAASWRQSELITLDVDTVTMHGAVEAFVTNRLLVRDRDALSGALTLEVAHEALLSEWERLRRWIDDGRDDLRQHAAYTLAVDDWLTAGRDHEYLLTGGRLEQFEHWRATTTMRLTASEREFLDDARPASRRSRRRRDRRASPSRRGCVAGPAAGRSRSGRGGGDRGGAIVAVMAAAGTERTAADRRRHLERLPTAERAATLYEQGLVRAERDFDLDVERHGRCGRGPSSATSPRVTTIS